MSYAGLLHNSLKRRTIVQLEIEPLESVRVGGERSTEMSAVDLPIVKYADGRPFIPGSSLKGMFRAEFTRVLNGMESSRVKGIIGMSRVEGDTSEIQELQRKYTTKELVRYVIDSAKGDDSGVLGVVDLLFGCPIFASPTVFTDALPVDWEKLRREGVESVRTRTHVFIDLDSDVAKERHLVEVESVDPILKFRGKVIYNSLNYGGQGDSVVDRAFNAFLQLFQGREVLIGGWRSRGYGLSRVTFKEAQELPFSLRPEGAKSEGSRR